MEPTDETNLPALIERRIYRLRGQNVLLDSDLAALYEVPTSALNQAIKRNADRFPEDFVFFLTPEESQSLISQSVTSNSGRGGRRKPIRAFTEQGVAMLSSVLRSERAVQVNIAVMRAFVSLRRLLLSNHELAARLLEMENKYDAQFRAVFQAIRALIDTPPVSERRIGFHEMEAKEK